MSPAGGVGVATWATRYRTSSTELTFDTLSSGYAAVLDIVVALMVRMEKKADKLAMSKGFY